MNDRIKIKDLLNLDIAIIKNIHETYENTKKKSKSW